MREQDLDIIYKAKDLIRNHGRAKALRFAYGQQNQTKVGTLLEVYWYKVAECIEELPPEEDNK